MTKLERECAQLALFTYQQALGLASQVDPYQSGVGDVAQVLASMVAQARITYWRLTHTWPDEQRRNEIAGCSSEMYTDFEDEESTLRTDMYRQEWCEHTGEQDR